MDACRTAVRLGAKQVYVVYRRTMDEMPADELEIEQAQQEGVVYKFLTNPIKFNGQNGKVKSITLQLMELGEPDSSGRRKPVAIDGKTEEIEEGRDLVSLVTCTPYGINTHRLIVTGERTTFAKEDSGVVINKELNEIGRASCRERV